jgi:hypothetical protein
MQAGADAGLQIDADAFPPLFSTARCHYRPRLISRNAEKYPVKLL